MKISKTFMTGALLAGLLTSCMSDGKTTVSEPETGGSKISFTLSGTNLSTRTTGAVSTTDEANINNVVVGVFNNDPGKADDGTVDNIYPFNSSDITANTDKDGKIINYVGTVVAKTANPKIIVVANVPSNYFANVQSLSEFRAKAATMDNIASKTVSGGTYSLQTSFTAATDTSNVAVQSSKYLPMVGTAAAVTSAPDPSDSKKLIYSTSVVLYRTVARIELDKITTAFDDKGSYAGYKFRLDQVYMYNVHNSSTWDVPADDNQTAANGAVKVSPTLSTTLSSGGVVKSLFDDGIPYLSYLGTGHISIATPSAYQPSTDGYNITGLDGSPLSTYDGTNNTQVHDGVVGATNTKTLTPAPFYFYVFPSLPADQMRLVLKGVLTDKAGNTKTIYYPVVINLLQSNTTIDKSGTAVTSAATGDGDGSVASNRIYKMNITIKSPGVTSPKDIITTTSIAVSMTIQNWEVTFTQNVTI